jgi:hypothetical protein
MVHEKRPFGDVSVNGEAKVAGGWVFLNFNESNLKRLLEFLGSGSSGDAMLSLEVGGRLMAVA